MILLYTFIILAVATVFKAFMNAGYVKEKQRYQGVFYNEHTKRYHYFQGVKDGYYFLAVNFLAMLIMVPSDEFKVVTYLLILKNTLAMHILLSWIFFELIMYALTNTPLLYTSQYNTIDKQFYKLPDLPKLFTGKETNAVWLADVYKLMSKIIIGSIAIYLLV